MPGLRVEIIAFDKRFVHPAPSQQRHAREELPAPDNFPAGWKLYRVGEGYVATTAEEQEVISWYKVPQAEIRYAWKDQEVPQLELNQEFISCIHATVCASRRGLLCGRWTSSSRRACAASHKHSVEEVSALMPDDRKIVDSTVISSHERKVEGVGNGYCQ